MGLEATEKIQVERGLLDNMQNRLDKPWTKGRAFLWHGDPKEKQPFAAGLGRLSIFPRTSLLMTRTWKSVCSFSARL